MSSAREREYSALPAEGECGWEGKNKQAAPERQDGQFTSASQDQILERKFHALSGRVTGWRRLRTFRQEL